jgi:hypothetical protein
MNKLVNLSIHEISGVTSPANKRKLLIIKSAKQENIEKSIKKEGDKFCLYDADGKKIGTFDTEAEAKAAQMKMNKGATSMLTKEQIAKIGDAELQEAVLAQIEELLAANAKVKELETAKSEGPKSSEDLRKEEAWKHVPAAIRNKYEAMEKQVEETNRLASLEKEARETDNWITKLRDFPYLQITPIHFGKVMQKVAASAPTEADEVFRILEKANDLVAKGAIFSEIGKSTNGRTPVGDATNVTARVEAMAEDLMQMDPKLNKGEAIVKALEKKPEWYGPYRREQIRVGARDDD